MLSQSGSRTTSKSAGRGHGAASPALSPGHRYAGPPPPPTAAPPPGTAGSSPGTSSRASRLRIVRGRIAPGAPRVEQIGRDVGHRDGDLEPEHRVHLKARPVQRTAERRAHHGAGVGQLHPRAGPVRAAAPAGVHQPDPRPVPRDPLPQHRGIHARMERQERCAEAGAEGGAGLGHARLGAGHLRRVAREEVIHRLIRREPGDRGHHAERVGGEKDHVHRMAADAAGEMVADVVDRIAGAGVFGDRSLS